MTHETLNKILKYINENVYMDTQYAIYYINDDVDLININATHCIELNLMNFYDFYLIKGVNTKDKYVGIVFDMGDDLHIFIDGKYRKQRYLHKTLVPTILPFIKNYKKKDLQYLSFESNIIKKYFIDEFGFKNCEKENTDYMSLVNMKNNYKAKNNYPYLIDEEIKESLVEELEKVVLNLKMIKQKLRFQKKITSLDFDNFSDIDRLYSDLKDDIRY